jgi:hypothetical protein
MVILMSDAWGNLFNFILGLCTGLVIGYSLCQSQAGWGECNETQPRNKNCILIAVPENNEVMK